jgi:hypothetical protein
LATKSVSGPRSVAGGVVAGIARSGPKVPGQRGGVVRLGGGGSSRD